MAKGPTASVVITLYNQMVSSTTKALQKSKEWQEENERINQANGGPNTSESRIKKRDSQPMKDAMSAYVWHRDHAAFCATILATITNGEIQATILSIAEPAGSNGVIIPTPR